jgi:hypothetical protein
MPALPLIAAAVPTILLFLGWLYHLPVVIRRNDERIENRDEESAYLDRGRRRRAAERVPAHSALGAS